MSKRAKKKYFEMLLKHLKNEFLVRRSSGLKRRFEPLVRSTNSRVHFVLILIYYLKITDNTAKLNLNLLYIIIYLNYI